MRYSGFVRDEDPLYEKEKWTGRPV